MYVCICNAITDKQIRHAAASGVTTFAGLQKELGVGAGCGTCSEHAASILHESSARNGLRGQPILYRPSLA
jgi:bacterioferritin-associated ferredoxin